MTGLLHDIRYGARSLAKSPSFTVVSLLTLALGIGANTAIFSFVDAVLLKPLPYADADRIVFVMEKPPRGGRNGISTLNYLDWKNQNSVFEYMTPFTGGVATFRAPVNRSNCGVARWRLNTFKSSKYTRFSAERLSPAKISRARTTSWC
ncbi:MAG: ABC transporter permease [Bryobacterales bacterium]|nr:ABC transporter permease [Bryobacterales bacterium]MBV9398157.1 ABC transporter permease [Bryobacterales bacterium]